MDYDTFPDADLLRQYTQLADMKAWDELERRCQQCLIDRPSPCTDEELLALYYLGDDWAFEQLKLRCNDQLHATAYSRVSGRADRLEAASDIVQETWLHVIRTRANGLRRWRPPHPVAYWLNGVVLPSRAVDYLRKEARHEGVSLSATDSEEINATDPRPDPGTQAALGLDLLQLLGLMPLERRDVFWKYRVEGLTVHQIVAQTELSQAAVYRLLKVADHQVAEFLCSSGLAPPRRDFIPVGPSDPPPETEITKVDPFVEHVFETLATVDPNPEIPILLKLKDPIGWTLPPGFRLCSRIGRIVSGRVTVQGLQNLKSDGHVLFIEANRDGGYPECDASVPCIRANEILDHPVDEEGDGALIALIESGIDILHEAFRDEAGKTRILAVWDQTDQTGPPPGSLSPSFNGSYGTVYTDETIQGYITSNVSPSVLPCDAHGTHVASIAAGQAIGGFAGGVARAAKILVVIPDRSYLTDSQRRGIGYSASHIEALAYVNEVAKAKNLPVVVNIILGMNVGSHDGKCLLEQAINDFTGDGQEPGRIVVKSAGNERNQCRHARMVLEPETTVVLPWNSMEINRPEDILELWFSPQVNTTFHLVDPHGHESAHCSHKAADVRGAFPSGNRYRLVYSHYFSLYDSRLLVLIQPGDAPGKLISPGKWQIRLRTTTLGQVREVHAWLERREQPTVQFANTSLVSENVTLTIPGTAEWVITVGAIASPTQSLVNMPGSSWGRTRDGRLKPEIVAPGWSISAASSGTLQGIRRRAGTSVAAPHVSGAIALVLSKANHMQRLWPTAAQIHRIIRETAQFKQTPHSVGLGHGLLDAKALFDVFFPPATKNANL